MYKVICAFRDLEDHEFIYKAGQEYPRKGCSPTKQRIDELLGSKNKMGKPLIEKVGEEKEVRKPKKTVKKAVKK